MIELMKKITSLLISMCFLATSMAQEAPQAEVSDTPKVRRYTVEVIIFSYTEDFGIGSEQFPPDGPPPRDEMETLSDELGLVDEVEVVSAAPKVDLVTYASNVDALEFVLLDRNEFTLTKVIDQFELLDAYETVMHFGWTQPTFPEEDTDPIRLDVFGRPPEGLDGSFALYLSRYLHLVVDLALEAPIEDRYGSEQAVPGYADSRHEYQTDFGSSKQKVHYRIQENRILKNGDIRYFDHPKFGVVAKVTRVEDEEEEAGQEPAEPDPLLGRTSE